MQELEDNTLLREYVERGSEEAFASLVERHVNKVYSVALRRTGDARQAEEITQAVFIILAKKSGQLGKYHSLSGWLYQTAQLAALTHIRGEIRRVRREQEAYMQTLVNEKDLDTWAQIAPLLEDAMAALNEADRHAIVLRFFDGKSMREVGAALGRNENAAKMRVNRAVEKLQQFFFKRGVTSTAETLTRAISTHSVQPAPIALAKTITAVALAKSTVASISTISLTKTTLTALAMKTKIMVVSAVVTVIIAALIIGAGTYYIRHVDYSVPHITLPVLLANTHSRRDANDPFFDIDVDSSMMRTSTSAPAIHIKGPTTPNSPLALNPPSDAAQQKAGNSSSIGYVIDRGSPLLGKRISVTGWLKTSDVQNWAAAYMCIYIKGKGFSRFDGMYDRPITGTKDWQQIELVTDVPNEPCILFVGPDLYGSGEMWGDDFQIALASPDEPVTDDRSWHIWQDSMDYTVTTDTANGHEGNPSVCLAYTSSDTPPRGIFMWWGKSIRVPESKSYLGHTVQMTGWIKTENVSGNIEPTIKVRASSGRILVNDDMVKDHSLKGTRDWTPFTVTCKVPPQTSKIDAGLIFWGIGKVWIDANSIDFEVVK
jgi:RNA polymerase sigma factor (sigma-70 family)